jgi:cellulose synthase (UDP-forming)
MSKLDSENSNSTKDLPCKDFNPPRELFCTWIAIVMTVMASVLLYQEVFAILHKTISQQQWWRFVQNLLFGITFLVMIYGNLVYQLARRGYLRRLQRHLQRGPADDEDYWFSEKIPPPVTILIPSFKEEPDIIRQALFSVALQDYPARRVVLLIDDPPQPADPEELSKLESARSLPGELQQLLDTEATAYRQALRHFQAKVDADDLLDLQQEFVVLSELYERAAAWFSQQASGYQIEDHTDELFVSLAFTQRSTALLRRAHNLRDLDVSQGAARSRLALLQGYRHLTSLFEVELSSFERKQYVNLSWAANKAMNLNSYLSLIGRHFNQTAREDGLHLTPTNLEAADVVVPEASFIVTLDADSLLAHDYVKRLVAILEAPGNERLAVVQTPYSAVPSPQGVLERIAGATTDLQYIVHQGFTQASATYWVGANAILRKKALDDIVTLQQERGFTIAKYIQDRTVIEDTESSIDLIVRGWSLFNLPERLSYSATPADFGALLIQRRRWANGGLIILPKLVRHLLQTPFRRRTWVEGFMRINYLTSTAGTNVGLLLILTFPADDYLRLLWLPLTALPYFCLYGRDLILTGYRLPDLFRVFALNFLLIPVNLGGVFKSMHQLVTGKQTPFCRTPKVRGRTAAPAGYVLAAYVLMFFCFLQGCLRLLSARWLDSAIFLGSALVLLYAIVTFIGWRASWEDLALPLFQRIKRCSTLSQAVLNRLNPEKLRPGATMGWRDERPTK